MYCVGPSGPSGGRPLGHHQQPKVPLPICTRKVQQSILATPCTAGSRPDARPVKDHLQAKKGSEKLLNKPKAGLTLEQQATLLLMKNSGVGGGPVQSDSEIVAQFPEQFVDPLKDGAIGGYRDMFGLKSDGSADALSALALHAEA